jgi:23S rRNA pseudouridine2605 synthase
MIELGQVTVNGKVITSPALNVTAKDRITVAGQPLGEPDPPRLWLYYKPEGLVTSAADEKGRETVFDRLPPDMPRVMSVGRLDLNSEGLLLLTNDGELKRRLELPSTGWLRKYRVRVKGNPVDPDLDPLRKGITVEGERFQPMTVTLDRVQGANAWLTVGLREGKNREIRRAMTAIGLTVNRLIRVSYGPFRLGEMQPGAVEEVRAKVLREQIGLDPAAEDTTGTATRKPRPARDGAAKPAARKPAPTPDGATSRPGAAPKPGTKPQGGAKPQAGAKPRQAVKTWSAGRSAAAATPDPAPAPRSAAKPAAGAARAPRNGKPAPAPRRPGGGPASGPKGAPRRGK